MRAAMWSKRDRLSAMFSRCAAQLAALDPTAVLRRGYAMVLDANATVVTDAAQVAENAPLQVQLSKGLLDVRVQARHLPQDAD
jgi:exodeoxyribonuclease VII large subunit